VDHKILVLIVFVVVKTESYLIIKCIISFKVVLFWFNTVVSVVLPLVEVLIILFWDAVHLLCWILDDIVHSEISFSSRYFQGEDREKLLAAK
jgi:hypothetical protein